MYRQHRGEKRPLGVVSECQIATTLGVLATTAIVTAAASASIGALNYVQSSHAAHAQEELVNQQKTELANEQARARAEAAAQAVSGQSFGFAGPTDHPLATGFGSAGGGSANSGRGQITGMG